jgi:hypothetical protein
LRCEGFAGALVLMPGAYLDRYEHDRQVLRAS